MACIIVVLLFDLFTMTDIITKLVESKTIEEVDRVVSENWDYITQNPYLFLVVRDTKKRITTVETEKIKSWKPRLN